MKKEYLSNQDYLQMSHASRVRKLRVSSVEEPWLSVSVETVSGGRSPSSAKSQERSVERLG
jgi:hypothetical protein